MLINLEKIALVLMLTLICFCASAEKNNLQDKSNIKPNILWIYVEDMNDWMGAYGDNTVATPNIDLLAKQGVRFNNAIMPALGYYHRFDANNFRYT